MRLLPVAGLVAGLLVLGACTQDPWALEVELQDAGVIVRSEPPIERVEILEAGGAPVLIRRFPVPLSEARVDVALEPEQSFVLRASRAGLQREIRIQSPPSKGPIAVDVEAPLGQQARRPLAGERLVFDSVEGASTHLAVRLTAREPGRVQLEVCGEAHEVVLGVEGEQQTVSVAHSGDDACPVTVKSGSWATEFVLQPTLSSLATARRAVRVERVVFPADRSGALDPGRSADRITLPSPGWERVLRSTGLGARARAAEEPWGFVAVEVRNDGLRPLSTVVALQVRDESGELAPAFRPQLRLYEGDTGRVTGLLQIPAGETSTALLPVFVDEEALPAGSSSWTRTVELSPVGSRSSLDSVATPFYVRRGSTLGSLGFLGALASMLGGLLLLVRRLGPWLRSSSTSELVTVALFANLMFVFAAASHLLGLGVATLLGPFSSLVTGLVDDAFRYTLLATLVTLLPRPGVVTLAIGILYLMRGLALGGFSPADPLLLGSAVLWLEGGLWLTGVTRSGAWRDEPPRRRWLRLTAAFGAAAVADGAVGLAAAAVLYRLYFADWYVVLILVVPGFLYTAAACWLATGFAGSLRRVEG